MKTTILLLIILFTMNLVNGQGYYNQHNEPNIHELSKAQLDMSLAQAQNLKSAGTVVTVLSSLTLVIGIIVYSNGLNEITSSNNYDDIINGANKGMSGVYVMYAGAIGMSIGIPLWIVGAYKINNSKIHLVKFDPLAYNSPKFGIGFSCNF